MTSFFASFADDAKALGTKAAWGISIGDYAHLLPKYPKMLRDRIFKTKSRKQMEEEAERKGPLKRTMGPVGLICVGIGMMLGAGIFVTPGTIAVQYTGPAVFISYLIAAVSAYLSCFCYCEFSVDMPLAGAAYTYIASSLGEFQAWVVTSNMLFEYILSAAAVVRGFSPYFAILIGKNSTFFQYPQNVFGKTYIIDWWGFGIVLFMTSMLAFGTKESTTANNVVTICHVLVMLFIIIAGFTQADTANYTPFFPEDHPQQWKGLFNGACIAFFSFIGFDAVATAAEEAIDPAKMMPIGILGSITIVTVIYTLMCVVLGLMVPRNMIDTQATFAAAFQYVGMDWATYIVSVGALLGILTSTCMNIYAPARVLASCTREGMLPPVLSWIGPKQTPWVATWVVGICAAMIALTTDFATLSNMVAMGSLVVFWFVAVALIWRRMHVPGKTAPLRMANQLLHIFAMIGFSLGFTLVWTLPVYNIVDGVKGAWADDQYKWLIAMGVLAFMVPVSMLFFCKSAYTPAGYRVPLYPFIPCGSIFINTFLLAQMNMASYERFGWWTLGVVLVYIVYGVFASQVKDNNSSIANSIKADLSWAKPAAPVGSQVELGVPVGSVAALQMVSAGSAVAPLHSGSMILVPAGPQAVGEPVLQQHHAAGEAADRQA